MVSLRLGLLTAAVTLLGACPEGLPVPELTPIVSIPGGNFTMGSTEDCLDEDGNTVCDPTAYALLDVFLSPFSIDRYEVTNAQYRYCVAVGGCPEPAATGLPEAPDYYTSSAYDEHPVVYVTWEMAQKYCAFAGRRLPTEAEWEFVASTEKDGESLPKRLYPWKWLPEETNQIPTCEHARFAACNEDHPGAVGSVKRDVSAWGVYDLGGNVAEWTSDLQYDYGYCRDERPIEELCPTGDTGCIATQCSEAGAACVRDCNTQDPYCLKQLDRVTDPTSQRGGPERSVRGGSFYYGRCKTRTYVRQKSTPEAGRPWIGIRCAGSSN